ncbi:TAXI family TRAP transporter solute-binding subunit [Chloroflexota bacterium]
MKRIIFVIVAAVLLITLILGGCGQPAPPPTTAPPPATPPATKPDTSLPPLVEDRSKWPTAISIGTAAEGSSVYAQGAVVGTIITKYLGIPMAPEVMGGTARYNGIAKGELEFGMGSEDNVQWAVYGKIAKSWKGKPIPLRCMIPADNGTRAIVVNAKSDIKTIADLKGKKYAWPSYSETSNQTTDFSLATAGLTLKDVVEKPLNSSKAGKAALIEGAVDAWMVVMGSPGGPAAETMDADNSIGIRALPLSEADAKSIEKSSNLCYHPIKLKAGYVSGNKEDFWAISFRRMVPCHRDAPEDFIYAVTKAFWEHLDEAKKALKDFDGYILPDQLVNAAAPYHPGAIRYYKEIGVWSDEMEKVNQTHLKNIGETR